MLKRCEICGADVESSGMGGHRGRNLNCKKIRGKKRKRDLLMQGWDAIPGNDAKKVISELERLGIPHKVDWGLTGDRGNPRTPYVGANGAALLYEVYTTTMVSMSYLVPLLVLRSKSEDAARAASIALTAGWRQKWLPLANVLEIVIDAGRAHGVDLPELTVPGRKG